METINVKSWDELKKVELKKIINYRNEFNKANEFHNPDILVFRGHRSSVWPLQTTLERYTSRKANDHYQVSEYLELIKKARTRISVIPDGIKWEILDSQEYSNWYKYRDFLGHYGLLDYMVFLRHHEFPSPFLDWTSSVDVAAYFAFHEVNPHDDKSVAIFVYLDNTIGIKGSWAIEPSIHRIRRETLIVERHKRQKSTYTYCTFEKDDREIYANHELVFGKRRKTNSPQDLLWKFILPSNEKVKVMEYLEKQNINTSALLPLDEKQKNAKYFLELFKDLGG